MNEEYLKERNRRWIQDIKNHTYPLAQADIAIILGISPTSYNKILKEVYWLYPEQYEAIMDIDVQLYLDTCPDVKRRTEKRLKKIVDEYELALGALNKYNFN